MARKPGMIYLPLDVEFFDNDKVLDAGEKSGWLFLAMSARAKKLLTDGILTDTQISRLHIRDWAKRMQPLLNTGLVEQLDDRHYLITGFLERNMSAAEVAERRARDRDRKKTGTDPHSTPPPGGFRAESDRTLREVEGKGREGKESRRGDVDLTSHQAPLRAVGGDA